MTGILGGNPKDEPMHYGEIFMVWEASIDIPVGARFTDPEIAAMLAANLAVGLVACSQAMGMSIREDIGALFAKYHLTKAAIGVKNLHLLKKKGWLIPPPLLVKRPEPVHA